MKYNWLKFSILFCLCMSTSGFADVLYVDGKASSSGNGSSWDQAFKTITEALSAGTFGDEIWVTRNSYPEKLVLKSGVSIYGGFLGHEAGLADRDVEQNKSIIDGGMADQNMTPYAHVIFSTSTMTLMTLDALVIRGNGAELGGYSLESGGGLLLMQADNTVTISNCIVENNHCETGGGIGLMSSSPHLINVVVRNNNANEGGGIRIEGGAPTLENCRIENNRSPYIGGLNLMATSATIDKTTIIGNDGYGVYATDFDGAVSDSTIAGNGAALYLTGSAELSRIRIFGHRWNNAPISITGMLSPTLTNCLISGNVNRRLTPGNLRSAILYLAPHGTDNTSIINSLFVDNDVMASTNNYEAAVIYDSQGLNVSLINTMITNNWGYGMNLRAVEFLGTDALQELEAHACLFFANRDGDIVHEIYKGVANTAYTEYHEYTGMDLNVIAPNSFNNIIADPVYRGGRTGIWSDAPVYLADENLTRLVDSDSQFQMNEWVGAILNPNTQQKLQVYVTSNTENTIYAVGDVTDIVQFHDTYQFMNYELGYGSAALDAGTSVSGLSEDLNGDSRPVDLAMVDNTSSAFDIGPFEASGAAQGKIRIVPSARPLNLGSIHVDAGPTPTFPIHVQNVGFGPLNLVEPRIAIAGEDDSEFFVTSDVPATLAAGTTMTLEAIFDPNTLGEKHALLRIYTNDPAEPLTQIGLVGSSALPFAPLLSLSPEQIYTYTSISASAIDPQGIPITEFSFDWYLNGDLKHTGNTLPANLTSKLQTWECRARALDQYGQWSEYTEAFVDILNSPPTQPIVKLLPEPISPDQDLIVDIQVYSVDPDGDEVAYDFEWYKSTDTGESWIHKIELDGSPQVSNLFINEGELWEVRFIPYEVVSRFSPDKSNGEVKIRVEGTYGWDRIYIGQNSPPQFGFGSVIRQPVGSQLQYTINWTATDNDGDSVTVNLYWSDGLGNLIPIATGLEGQLSRFVWNNNVPAYEQDFYLHAIVEDQKGAVDQVRSALISGQTGIQRDWNLYH